MTFEYVKVFGERNTGTNFLNQFLRLNTSLKVLEHGDNTRCKQRVEKICTAHDITDPVIKEIIFERMIDAEREHEFPRNFGWKHASISPHKLAASPLYDRTLFICLVRNPWKFLTSLYRRPYNLIPMPETSFSRFIRSPFVASARDGIKDVFLPDPVELWNLKVNSYHGFYAKSSSKMIFLYYEQLVVNITRFASRLSGFCEVDLTAVKVPNSSTKGDQKSYAQYRDETINYDPLNSMTAKDASYICQRLDQSLIAKSPYSDMYSSLSSS